MSAEVPQPEVTAFSASEAYVYSIPPATTVGHRAETWNVNNWLQEVKVKVTTEDEEAWIRLEDPESGSVKQGSQWDWVCGAG